MRIDFGLLHTVWLIGIVVVTDTAGYIIGRTVGGPKVFPRISPKKTWSGVLAGWLAVALFSWSFVENVAPQNLFFTFVSISILLSVAAQIGDMIQSHLKRKSYVKDSSNLLPGHGGFMDRFDGFTGATVVIGLVSSGSTNEKISILGATGSIGQNTLNLISNEKDKFKVVGLTGQ